jgi:hypothetical protein
MKPKIENPKRWWAISISIAAVVLALVVSAYYYTSRHVCQFGRPIAFQTIENTQAPGFNPVGDQPVGHVPVMYSGKDLKLAVIPDQQTLPALGDHVSTSTRRFLDQLDYAKATAIVVFRGYTGVGDRVEIRRVVRSGAVVNVCTRFESSQPGAGVSVGAMDASPYHVIVVPRSRLQGATIFELKIEQVYYTQ